MGPELKIPVSEIEKRISLFQEKLSEAEVEGALIVQRVDLLYFSGTAQNGVLFIPAKGEPLLFIKRYYPRAKEESALSQVIQIESIKQVPQLITGHLKVRPSPLGLEMDVLPIRDYEFYRSLFSDPETINISPIILELRMKKSAWEIEQIRKVAHKAKETFEYAASIIDSGASEIDFASALIVAARKSGHGGRIRVRNSHEIQNEVTVIRGPLIQAAPNVVSFRASTGLVLAPGDPILIDLKWMLNGYHIHERRLFGIKRLPDNMVRAWDALEQITHETLGILAPKVKTADLFEVALNKACSLGYEKEFLEGLDIRDIARSCIGYGIGLELVEPPYIKHNGHERLKEGLTLVLRPSLLLNGSYLVSMANVFVLTDIGYECITKTARQAFIC